jgi:hypothetical protein
VTPFWKRRNRFEQKLKDDLAKAPEGFVQMLADRIDSAPVSRRAHGWRLATAAGLIAAGLSVLGAFGGLSTAARAVSSATGIPIVSTHKSAPAHTQKAQAPQAAKSPSDDQYGGKTTICHKTGNLGHGHPYWVVITVDDHSLPAHKAHGDTLVNPNPPPDCPGPPIP